MGYVENILGDSEHIVYSTHQHFVVLLQRVIGSLFAFAVFLALGLAVLVPDESSGERIRFTVGLIALGSVVMPLYLIVSAWIRGLRGREFVRSIWRAALAGIVILVVALILLFAPAMQATGWIAIVIAVVPLFEMVRIVLDWFNERYIITNRRVMEVGGTINKHVRDSALEKVNDVDLKQSVIGRMLGYGTVQIITGSDIGMNMFHRISDPVRFKRAMLNAKEQLNMPAGESDASPRLPDLGADADIPGLIEELDTLRQRGILSEEEFQAKKKELLERL
jgi:hypothetical protein